MSNYSLRQSCNNYKQKKNKKITENLPNLLVIMKKLLALHQNSTNKMEDLVMIKFGTNECVDKSTDRQTVDKTNLTVDGIMITYRPRSC